MLLTNPNAQHTLADDLDSFLHVLSWVARRYMPHALDSAELSKLMQDLFDDAYEGLDGSVRGGRAKKDAILADTVPRRSGFHNPMIASLLKKLTRTIAVRYEDPPTEEDSDGPASYKEALKKYTRRRAQIEPSDWMLDIFREAVENRSAWPADDK